jgi:hypothetical protein
MRALNSSGWKCIQWGVALSAALAFAGCGSDSGGSKSPGDKADEGDGNPSAGSGSGDDPPQSSHDPAVADQDPGPCESASVTPCNSFTTDTGIKIELGPYGAIMEPNVGKGFENAVAIGDSIPLGCQVFAATFGEDPDLTNKLLDTHDLDFALYTIYRPAKWKDGEKYPIITWGNGTCAQPEGYGALLRYVASQGFFIIASNNRWVGGATEMLHGLDFVFKANEDPDSPYYHRLDTSKVAAMGHSQGGLGTSNASADSRIQTVVLFNGGTSAQKPFLALSGDMDISGQDAATFGDAVKANPEAAFIFYHMVPPTGSISGHLTLMLQPQRVNDPTVAWLKYQLLGDEESKGWFVGSDCKLCGHDDDYEYGENGLK